MDKLIFVFVGLLLAAIILTLLTAIVRRHRNQKAAEAIQQQMESKVEQQPELSAEKAVDQAPQKATAPAASPLVTAPTPNLDEIIQSGFGFLEEGAYEQAIKLFQKGLHLTEDSKISVQLYLELAKIHNTLSEQAAALKDLDSALEFCRKSNNGLTEKEILQIRQMISSQKSRRN